jgi:hypothetical protein
MSNPHRPARFISRLAAVTGLALVSALGFFNCAPSVNPALKSSIDGLLSAPAKSQDFSPPSALMPPDFEVGQWTKIKIVDKKGRPTVYTQKIVGEEGGAWWMETVTENYSSVHILKMLVKMDRRDPNSVEIRKVFQKTDDSDPLEIDGPALSLTQGLYKKSVQSMTVEWKETERVDAVVQAGNFAQCYAMDSKVSFGPFTSASKGLFHSSVPINGLVSSSSDGTVIELLDFGMSGAQASF